MKKNVYFLLSILVLLHFFGCSKQGMIKSPETESYVLGSLHYPQGIELQPSMVAHVILADVTLSAGPIAIASQTINQPSRTPIPFKIIYDASIIDPEHTYSVQACIKVDDQFSFASVKT